MDQNQKPSSPDPELTAEWTLHDSLLNYQDEIDKDYEIKEGIRGVVKMIDKLTKRMLFKVQAIHQKPSDENLKSVGEEMLNGVKTDTRPIIEELLMKIPKNEGFKYSDLWKFQFQKLSGLAAIGHFLTTKKLLSMPQAAEIIGVPHVTVQNPKATASGAVLDYDDYLVGLLDMSVELTRLSRNVVAFQEGNNDLVYTILECFNQLNSGMHFITFKNDYIRKRYDGLKYNVKTVEEVAYDLKIHNMVPRPQNNSEEAKTEKEDKAQE